MDRVGRGRAYVHGLRVPVWIRQRRTTFQHASLCIRGGSTYLHILHRIRLLGTMTGVFGADSDPGVWGYPANMSPGGTEPSPSNMIRLASYAVRGTVTRGQQGVRFTHSSLLRLFFPCKTSERAWTCERSCRTPDGISRVVGGSLHWDCSYKSLNVQPEKREGAHSVCGRTALIMSRAADGSSLSVYIK